MAYFPFEVPSGLSGLGFEARDVETALGSVRVWVHRDPTAPQTLFLHGVGLGSSSWAPYLEAAREREVDVRGWVLVDVPGFGDSADLAGPATIDDVVAALEHCLDVVGAGRVDLVGHSMGGFLALHMAATSDRVASLVVQAGAYATVVDVVNSPLQALRRSPRTTLMYGALAASAHAGPLGPLALRVAARTGLLRLALVGLVAHPLRVRSSLLAALAEDSRPSSFRIAQSTGRGYDCAGSWSRIGVPTLALFGSADALVTGRDADVLRRALPTATLAVVEGAGHLLPLELPFEVLDRTLAWRQPPHN